MILRTHLLLMGGLVLASVVLGVASYPHLPNPAPVHWNLRGEPDRFGSPWELAVLIPAINVVVLALFVAFPWLGPFRSNFERFRVTYGRIAVTLLAGLFALHAVILAKAAGWSIEIGSALCVVLGLMAAVIGNWLGKVRRNFYLGIRTPWTLANELVWERTHRVGARLFVLHGLLAATTGLWAPSWVCFVVLVGGLGAVVVSVIVYSFVCYRRLGSVDDLPTG